MSKITELCKPLAALAKKNKPPERYILSGGMIGAELFSEEGMAEYIASGLDGRILFCDPTGGWLVYDDSSGVFTGDNAEDVVFELIKIYRDKIPPLIVQVAAQGQNDAFKFYKSMMDAGTKRAIISLLKHEPCVAALPGDFNRDPDAVNCAGTVFFSDGSSRPATQEDKLTFSLACKPEEGIPENYLAHINWASCGNKELVEWKLTAYGISLFGHPTDRIINYHGPSGRNGKGAEIRPIYKIMGSYATVLPRPLAIKEPYSSSRFDRESLVGKRQAVLFDFKVEKGKLNLDDLKTLCGNGDPQSVEPKGKRRYDAVICVKIFILSNDKIPIDSFGASEKERFYLVPFNNHIKEKDEGLEDRFVPEYGKILNLLIEHAVKYFQNGRKMPPCAAIDRATAEYFDSQDLVGQFMRDNFEEEKEIYIGKTELYANFSKWCEEQHGIEKPMQSKSFALALEKMGFSEKVKKIDGKAKRVFWGRLQRLQKNLEFDLPPHEGNKFTTDIKTENFCNLVTEGQETATGTGAHETGPKYSGEEQKRIWEDPKSVIY